MKRVHPLLKRACALSAVSHAASKSQNTSTKAQLQKDVAATLQGICQTTWGGWSGDFGVRSCVNASIGSNEFDCMLAFS
jgi:hypothetical protein